VQARRARSWFLLLGGLLLAGAAAGLAAQFNRNIHAFVIIVLLQGAVWAIAAAVIRLDRERCPSLALILGAAILLRAVALASPVLLSDDIYRYVWDGRVQAAGINPYRYLPTDPELAPLRDAAIFPNINRKEYALTIYPPVAQMVFLVATRLGESVAAMKLALVAIEAIGIWALIAVLRAAEFRQENILLYAWHPLPVWEIAGSGHIDAAIVAFVALAVAALLRGRSGWSGAALAAATLVKFVPLVLAPALWHPTRTNSADWRWPTAFAAVVVLAYLPFIGAGRRVLGFLPGYVSEENLVAGGGFWLVRALGIPVAAYLLFAAAILAFTAIGALRRPADPAASLPWAAALGITAVVLLSPHYSWYFVWLVALLCAAPWWPGWWPSLTAALLYWDPASGHPPWVGFTIYGGFAIFCVLDFLWRMMRSAERPRAPVGAKTSRNGRSR
jgi:alpha-1,6-mannosyltransferase